MKKPGIIIRPIQGGEVDAPEEDEDDCKKGGKRRKIKDHTHSITNQRKKKSKRKRENAVTRV